MVSKVDPELRNVLQVLGFFDLTSVPKMKDVVKMFRKMALKKHPDKPGGSTEEFQVLQEAFLKIGSHIESQQNENVNNSSKDSNSEDFEESVAKNIFRDYYHLKGNFMKSKYFHLFSDKCAERLHLINVNKKENLMNIKSECATQCLCFKERWSKRRRKKKRY